MTKEDLSITYENNIFYCTKNNTKWISVDGKKWYGEEKRIAELEKENAELKGIKDVATLIRANNDTVITLMQLNNKLVSKSQQLTKAIELLEQFLEAKNSEDTYKAEWEAEQFLKDCDIDNAIQQANKGLDFDKIADEMEQDLKDSEVEKRTMSEEELEKLASERAEEETETVDDCDYDGCSRSCARDYYYFGFKDGFLTGLKAKTQWHDLRKDPNDLPKEVGNYIVCYLGTACERHTFELSFVDYFEDKHWIDEGNHNIEGYDEGVIAWCEIPTFTD